MADFYIVVVKHNVVQAIERTREPPDRLVPTTPLDVSTELANNNRLNGCIDGCYYFSDTRHARTFASLCLEFTKALVERRLADIDKLPAGSPAYRAADGRDDDGSVGGRAGSP